MTTVEKNLRQVVNYDQVKAKIIEVREQKVILDSDVAGCGSATMYFKCGCVCLARTIH